MITMAWKILTCQDHYNVFKRIINHKIAMFGECCKQGIPIRGVFHDLNKLYPKVFMEYVKFLRGDGGECKYKDLHYYKSPHHLDYWKGRRIPLHYLKEILADWIVVCRHRGTTPLKWYTGKREKLIIHPESRKWLEGKIGYVPEQSKKV